MRSKTKTEFLEKFIKFKSRSEPLSSESVIERVYLELFKGRAVKLDFGRVFLSEVYKDDMKAPGMAETYMVYELGKIVELEGMPWIVSLGRSGRGDFNVSRDIIALQAESPSDIERRTRYFSHSLIRSRTSGRLDVSKVREIDERKLRGLLEGIDDFVHQEANVRTFDTTPIYGLSLLESPRTYKSEVVDFLTKRLEARLQLIAEGVTKQTT